MEQDISQKESFLKAFFEALGDLVFVLDKDNKFVFFKGPEEELLLSPDKFLRRKVEEVLPPSVSSLYYSSLKENLKGKKVEYDYSLEVDGKTKVFHAVQAPVFENGEFRGVVTVVRNITSTVNTHKKLKEIENAYKELFDNVPVGIYALSFDGRVIKMNPSGARILDLEPGEVEGLRVEDFYDNPAEAKKLVAKLLDGDKTILELKMRTKSGKSIHIRSVAKIRKGDDGNHYIEGVFEDITNLKDLEKELRKNLKKMGKLLQDIVFTFSRIIEFKDHYTAIHQQRVANLAMAIAREMGFENKLRHIMVAGLLHDIGKIAIPSDILTKPKRLTDLEYELIKQHPVIGYDILKEIDFPWPVAHIVLQHHEKMDGSGYPYGMKGDEIMMEARILCVADVVDAISSHRPYRPALGLDRALQEIKTNKGKLYDPDVVDACVSLFNKGYTFRNIQDENTVFETLEDAIGSFDEIH